MIAPGDLDTELGRRSRGFEPDQSGPDHDQMLARRKAGLDGAGVRLGAQIVHPRHAHRQQWQLAHRRAGGDHQCVIGKGPAGGDDLARRAVDRSATSVELDRDAVAGETVRAGDRSILRIDLPQQHSL